MNAASNPPSKIELQNWGLVPYAEAWERQRALQREVIAGTSDGVVVLCEHPPTITAGSSTAEGSLRVPENELAEHGVQFFKIERGGDLTYHGPGQLVCYPLLNLNHFKRDVHWYMRALEAAIIRTCLTFGVTTGRISGRTGVWIPESMPPRKIASIGVRLSRWCSLHGLALNVAKQPQTGHLLNPCGFSDIIVTSLEDEQAALRSAGLTAPATPQSLSLNAVSRTLASELANEIGFRYVSEA
jgi:lipoyl(octanoyl) transferase